MELLKTIRSSDAGSLDRLFRARRTRLADAEAVSARIIESVRREGDSALLRFSKKFDGLDLRKLGFTVSEVETREAFKQVPRGFRAALEVAARNIRAVARRQLPREWRAMPTAGVTVRQIVRPLRRVACYVPGGRFPLPSTVLMSCIPAQVAGVPEIMIASPRAAPAVLVAADFLGVQPVFRLGGVQAIAAFAYGTESVPRVDMIVGPGNRYVAAAKKLVAGDCAIEFVAGPTELVIAGARGNPHWIAADLVAQAEHDPDAMALLVTPSRRLALQVQSSAADLVRRLGVANVEKSLAAQGGVVLTRDLPEAFDVVNRLAPEHLTLLDDAAGMIDRVESAGSIFLGGYSAVAAGDYASGTNHILPTGGAARLRGGLSAADFVKTLSVQELSRAGLSRLRRTITVLAECEGLKAHANSVEARFRTDAKRP